MTINNHYANFLRNAVEDSLKVTKGLSSSLAISHEDVLQIASDLEALEHEVDIAKNLIAPLSREEWDEINRLGTANALYVFSEGAPIIAALLERSPRPPDPESEERLDPVEKLLLRVRENPEEFTKDALINALEEVVANKKDENA